MSELVLAGVIVALLGLLGWQEKQNRAERAKLVNALIARTPEQMRDLEFVDKIEPPKFEEKAPDLIPVDQMSDEEFGKYIEENNG